MIRPRADDPSPALRALARLVGFCEARANRLAGLAGGGLQARQRARLHELAGDYNDLARDIRGWAAEHGVPLELAPDESPRPSRVTEPVILGAVERVVESELPVALRRAVLFGYRSLHDRLERDRRRTSSAPPPARSGILAS